MAISEMLKYAQKIGRAHTKVQEVQIHDQPR